MRVALEKKGSFLVPSVDVDEAGRFAQQLEIHPLVARLLLARGFVDVETAQRFLTPRLSQLRAPEGAEAMAGFSKAVDRIERALLQKETIGVFGDYDVDGVTTCALLTDFLREAGAEVIPRIAQRNEGYGFGQQDAEALIRAGCSLIITGDCGTSDHATLAYCKEHGRDVVIVDHHQVPDRTPDACALLNPHQPGCAFPFKGLASVGVAFYLAVALRTRLKGRGFLTLPDPRNFLDLVALGTIADLSPLQQENRILVTAGLRALSQTHRPGLQELARLSGLAQGASHQGDVAFRLAPRLNAPGRLGNAEDALGVLLEKDPTQAQRYALACDRKNQERQGIQKEVFDQARAQAATWMASHSGGVLVVAGEGWHSGVVGIVAAKLVDEFDRPAVVIALEGNVGRGSARSAHGFHLYKGLRDAADAFLIRYGGHAAAAGLSIHAKDIFLLREALGVAYRDQVGDPTLAKQPLQVDAEADLAEMDLSLLDDLARLGPFGMGNPEPLFLVRGVELAHKKTVGGGHLQCILRAGDVTQSGIGFGLAKHAQHWPVGHRLDAACIPEIDTYVTGLRRVRLRVRGMASIE